MVSVSFRCADSFTASRDRERERERERENSQSTMAYAVDSIDKLLVQVGAFDESVEMHQRLHRILETMMHAANKTRQLLLQQSNEKKCKTRTNLIGYMHKAIHTVNEDI